MAGLKNFLIYNGHKRNFPLVTVCPIYNETAYNVLKPTTQAKTTPVIQLYLHVFFHLLLNQQTMTDS